MGRGRTFVCLLLKVYTSYPVQVFLILIPVLLLTKNCFNNVDFTSALWRKLGHFYMIAFINILEFSKYLWQSINDSDDNVLIPFFMVNLKKTKLMKVHCTTPYAIKVVDPSIYILWERKMKVGKLPELTLDSWVISFWLKDWVKYRGNLAKSPYFKLFALWTIW